jgi:hypothetical protein
VYEELRTAGLRLVLERLEIGHRSKKAENAFIADGLQIEHIMPRRWATNWPLEGKIVPQNVAEYPYMASGDLAGLSDAIRRRNSVLHTLGNLTLLNPYLNPAASNGSFEVKWNEYKQSVLRLNRYFDSRNDWEETAIAARGKTLGELLCNIWPRPAE